MTKDELREFVIAEISMSGTINIKMSQKEIDRIIDNETKQIYEIYRDALVEKYTIIPREYFYTPEFRKNRTLKFPDCIKSVTRFEEMTCRSMMWGINDPDVNFHRAFTADLWMSPMGSDTVVFRTIQWNMWNQLKNFNLVDIQHTWNRNTHTLVVKGHDPRASVYVEVFEEVPPEQLYEDPWVRKWICAKAKKQVAKALGLIQYNTIGGATINYNLYTEEAQNDIEECKEFFASINTPDWFISFP